MVLTVMGTGNPTDTSGQKDPIDDFLTDLNPPMDKYVNGTQSD